MEEMEIDGKKYLSSKQAAKVTGYAKDYVGQLCREGRVEAKLIGRSWYVYEKSIREHRFGVEEVIETADTSIAQTDNHKEEVVENITDETSEITNKQATWEQPTYTPEVASEVVPLTSITKQQEEVEKKVDVTEMQEAWRSWFESLPQKESQPAEIESSAVDENLEEEEEVAVPVHIVSEPQIEPQRAVYSDIQPISIPAKTELGDEPVAVRSKGSRPYVTQTKEKSWLAYKALSIAVIIIAISFTLVAVGVITPLTNHTTDKPAILDFISGETQI